MSAQYVYKDPQGTFRYYAEGDDANYVGRKLPADFSLTKENCKGDCEPVLQAIREPASGSPAPEEAVNPVEQDPSGTTPPLASPVASPLSDSEEEEDDSEPTCSGWQEAHSRRPLREGSPPPRQGQKTWKG